MTTHRSTISVLRFSAGPLRLGVAAEDVVAVMAARADIPHIARLFGVEPGRNDLERRTIQVTTAAAGQGSEPCLTAFQADFPVEVVRCGFEDVLPMGPWLECGRLRPVMGFARIDDETLVLLDIPSVVDMLQKREGGTS